MPKRGDNIYRRKDGRWEGRYPKFQKDGRTVFGSVFARSYREAKEKLATAKYAWKEGLVASRKGKCMLGAVSDSWLRDSEAFLKESTVSTYRGYLCRYIRPRFARTDMSSITDESLMEFCVGLLESGGTGGQGLSPKTVSEIFRVMEQLRRFAMLRGITVGYTAECINIRQRPKKIRVFSPSERKRLHAYLDGSKNRSHIGILLCLATGLRLGELCALTWDDISLDERKLHVRRTLQRVHDHEGKDSKTKVVATLPKSDSSVRTIPLTEGICSTLAPFMQAGTYLLTGDAQKHMDPRTLQNHFKAALRKAGVKDANFHALRHTFATQCIEAGFDPKCLSELLGHSSVSITLDFYVHPTMSLKRRNMEKLVSFGF